MDQVISLEKPSLAEPSMVSVAAAGMCTCTSDTLPWVMVSGYKPEQSQQTFSSPEWQQS